MLYVCIYVAPWTCEQGRPKPLWGPKQNFIWGPLSVANMTGYCQSLIIHTL